MIRLVPLLLAIIVSIPLAAQMPVLMPMDHLVLVDSKGDIVARDLDPSITASELRFDFGEYRNFRLDTDAGRWVRWTEKRRYYTGVRCSGSEYVLRSPATLTDVVAFIDEAGVLWAGRAETVLVASRNDAEGCANLPVYLQIVGARVSPLVNVVELHPEPLRYKTIERARAVSR